MSLQVVDGDSMFIMPVDACHVAAARAQTDCLYALRILLKLERVNFLASVGVPNVNRWAFTDLSSNDLGTICGDIKAENVVAVVTELVTSLCSFLSHGDLFAPVEFLSVIFGVKHNAESSHHVDGLSFR